MPKAPRGSRLASVRRAVVLGALRAGASVQEAADAAECSYPTARKWGLEEGLVVRKFHKKRQGRAA